MNRTLLLLSVALLVAGFLSFWMYQQQYRVERGGGPTIEVVSALIDIELGQPVRAEWLTTEEIPQSYLEERHIPASAMRDLIGLPLAQSVLAGETVLRTDLSSLSDSRRTLSGTIPTGQRAVTIMARATSTFGGLLRPGDRVDVLLTVGSRELPDTWRQVVVLENVLVLAVGQEFEVREAMEASASSGSSRGDTREVRFGRATNITLQVSIEQGALLTIARQRGGLTLLLRNPNDVRVGAQHPDIVAADVLDARRRARFLRRTAAVAPPAVAPPAVAPPAAAPGAAVPGTTPAAPAATP